ncbi:MAG: antibiotic biosynthesis monooxygenase family protein [Cyclobacteriaceae bacterium]
MKKYGLHGKFNTQKGKADELADILIEASQIVSKAKGCQLYVISKDPSLRDAVWVTEIWDTKADHDASLSIPEVRSLITKAIPLIDGAPSKGQELEVMGGYGI